MKMIIDTDPGIDDALAIALAHALPEIELLGLTTVFGNTFVHQSSRNARYILDLLGADLPVAEGAALPWGATTYQPSANVHGTEGLGDLLDIPQIGQNAHESAAAFLVRNAAAHPGALVVCAIGPLTNIADAIKLDPHFATNVKQLVIMGGAYDIPGNITPEAEANIFHDIAAANAVFAAGFDLVMVGLNATHQTLLTADDFAQMAQASAVGQFIDEISHYYLRFYESVGKHDGCAMHDSTAVLACVYPERFTFIETGLFVDEKGATIADPSRPVCKVAMDVEGGWAVDLAKATIFDFGR
ncbi:Inosine-uridine nucleoside N-ribohydrolase [Cognatiyoonia koreensis]|uniref:Inosine-uridine nucleoside N-ribohydrolase n=1 Tax=Cognatiyoonia koreensis TaxID=364200 RepID=A0A1I0RZ71_9RHOB|nr:nucleoside hydrolase [Cognatiyoonia koreensis]SEW46260.1 Inosine-uridine nucleoside N-ribohydrolase [Cognatiyoonia koreensis]